MACCFNTQLCPLPIITHVRCELCPCGAEEEDSVVEDNLNIGVIFSPSHFYSGCARRQGNLSLHNVRVYAPQGHFFHVHKDKQGYQGAAVMNGAA